VIRARFAPTFEDWRRAARRLIAAGVPPQDVVWAPDGAGQDLLEGLAGDVSPPDARAETARVPRGFFEVARLAADHRDDQRWALLYRVLWRLTHEERHLLELAGDPDVRALRRLSDDVRRDTHKMHAFVRFTKVEDPADGERYVAWYRPDHFIARRAAAFFAERFPAMRWSVLTPDLSAHWDGRQLTFTPGVPRSSAPQEDELSELWRAYYGAVFNPARVNLKAMRAEMPVRHWSTLPETRALAGLLAAAPGRVNAMIGTPRAADARAFVPPGATLDELRTAVQRCQGCDLFRHATQGVFGNGAAAARVMLIGEQPGDQEDLAGQPFVGPAGEVLQRALAAARIDRGEVYLTNAVKHFKWEPRGKRRLHQTPRVSEMRACRPWLEAEIGTVRPELIVCLGSTASQALMGPQFRIGRDRGRVLSSPWAPSLIATYHPSAVLRAGDPGHADEVYRALVEDLRLARETLEAARAVQP
jgi:DNA polymerase